MAILKLITGAVTGFARRKPILCVGFSAIALVSVFAVTTSVSSDMVTRDFSAFKTYQFKQTHGLGFCGDLDRPYSAEITRHSDGTMAFSHSLLALAGTDPAQCDGGVSSDAGCFRPTDQPSRELSPRETARVTAVFAQTPYFKNPDPICREMGIDPCMIGRHAWDGTELNDFICANDRLSAEQNTKLNDLLVDLKTAD